MRDNRWTWLALIGLGVVALLFFLAQQFPDALKEENSRMRLVHGLLWVTLIGGSLILGWRERAGVALKQAMIWVAFGLFLVVVYSYRYDLMGLGGDMGSRVASSLMPSKTVQAAPGVVYLSRSLQSGHFHANALVNGNYVSFLVDTGATDVALSMEDAQRIGLDPEKLVFNVPYQTANGITMGARVMVEELKIGDITVRNVRASVSRNMQTTSLLGMSFLGRLGSIEVKGDRLILRQ